MTGAQLQGDMDGVMTYMHEFYFESAAMIVTLITVGKMLEARSKGRTTDALKGLMKLAPQDGHAYKNGAETKVSIDQVQIGDIFRCTSRRKYTRRWYCIRRKQRSKRICSYRRKHPC